jgi:hypothetical protein
MANQPRILQSAGDLDRFPIPVGASTDLEMGDFVSLESNAAVLMDAAAEDATFAGYMINQVHTDYSEPDQAIVGLRGILLCTATSATYGFGDGLVYTAENTVAADAGANTMAWSGAEETAAVTSLKVIIDVIALGKLFAVDA